MGLPDLYPAQVGSPYTTLAAPYTTGDTTLTVVDATKLPDAPNIVCLAGAVAGEFRYTGKDGNILQGVAALPGTPAATTWPAGTFAFRGVSAYDHNALIEYAQMDRPKRGAYDVIIYISDTSVIAEDANGATIASGTAGTDDATVIQAAHDALPARGGQILLGSGTFTLSSAIEFTKLVHFRGRGPYNTVVEIATGGTNGALALNLASSQYPFSKISDMTFRGSNTATTDPMIRLQANCQDTQLCRLYILNHAGPCISIEAGWDIYIDSCIVENNAGIGLVDAAGYSGHIINSHFVTNLVGVAITKGTWDIVGGKIAKSAEHNILLTSPDRFAISGTRIEDAGGKTPTTNTYDDIHITTDGVTQIGRVMISDLPFCGAYEVASSSRYGVYVDRNGLALTSDRISIRNTNFVDHAAGSIGFADAGSWTKRFQFSGLGGVWGIYDSRIAQDLTVPWGTANTAVVGTGVATISDTWVMVATGANAASSARAYSDALIGFSAAGGTGQRYDLLYYTRPLWISFEISRELAGASPTGRVQIVQATTNGALADKGLGIVLNGYDLYTEVHDGTTRTSEDTGVDLASAGVYRVEILFLPGQFVAWFVDGACVAIQTANLPAAATAASSRLMASIETTDAGNARMIVSNVRIRHLGDY